MIDRAAITACWRCRRCRRRCIFWPACWRGMRSAGASGLSVLRIGAALRSGWRQTLTDLSVRRVACEERPGAAAVRAVLGAARAGRAQPIDRSGGGGVSSSACSSGCSGPIHRRRRWCCRPCRSTSCMPNRRARGSKRAAARCASTRRRRSLIDGDRVTGVRVRDEVDRGAGRHLHGAVARLSGAVRRAAAALAATIANASALASLPIVTVNLWFDRAVMHEPLVGLPGRNFQWVFDRRAIVGGDRVAPVADLERRRDDRVDVERRAGRDGAGRSSRRPAGRAHRHGAEEPCGAREALDVFAGRRRAAAAAEPGPRSTDSCWPATGSTPDCRRRSSRP